MIAFVSHSKNRIITFHSEEGQAQSLRTEDKSDSVLKTSAQNNPDFWDTEQAKGHFGHTGIKKWKHAIALAPFSCWDVFQDCLIKTSMCLSELYRENKKRLSIHLLYNFNSR